ncbi:tRNA modification GTPase [Maribacter algicola]|uniref:tRNA modification GTPase n=1 Tax=Meishania litoralis TaxID=3434685 RepID=A0ACC7LMT8_9FLAO
MKGFLLFTFLFIFGVFGHSQISYEKGYFIDNLDRKTECLIRNLGWKNNPKVFEYKLTEDGEVLEKTLHYVKELGIYNKVKYNRFVVDIDRSGSLLSNMDTERRAKYTEEELFLRVLVEGEASLYMFDDGNLRRFFYTVGQSEIEQLVYKSYKSTDYKIKENNKYKNQLWEDLKCSAIQMSDIKLLNYSKNELVRTFVKFNECKKAVFTNYNEKQSNNNFHLTIRPGIKTAALTLDNGVNNNRDAQFDAKTGMRIGLEAEYVMPFNGGKWAIILEPTYQYYEAEKQLERYYVKANYKSMELPIGIRHYMFLSKGSKLFLNGSFVLDFPSKNSFFDYDTVSDVDMRYSPNLALGLGYKSNDKISIEIRFYSNRDVTKHWQTSKSTYKAFSIIAGYSFF